MKGRQSLPDADGSKGPDAIVFPVTIGFPISSTVLAGVWLLAAPALCLIYMTVPPSPDQSQFDYMAWLSTRGQPYYSGSFDVNWPGAMVLHEIGLRLFGVHPWTWRLTDFVFMQGFTIMGALFLWRASFRLAPFVFLALYPALYISSGGWMVGQRDIVGTGFLLAACAFAMPGGRSEASKVVLCGALIACGVLIRPTYLTFLFGMIALEAIPLSIPVARTVPRWGRAVLMGTGFSAAILAICIAGLVQGNLDDWFEQTVLFSLNSYVGLTPNSLQATFRDLVVGSWHWLSLFAVLGLLFWLWRDGLSYSLTLVLGIIATVVVSYVVQGKGFGYHLGGIMLALAILSSVSVDRLSVLRAASTGKWRGFLTASLVIVALVILSGTAKKISSKSANISILRNAGVRLVDPGFGLSEEEKEQVIDIIQSGTSPDDYLVQYGRNYDIPFRAQRFPSFRFFTPGIERMSEEFALYGTWLQEVSEGLKVKTPTFLLIERKALADNGLLAKDPELPVLRMILDLAHDGYDVAYSHPEILLLRKIGGP